MEGLKFTGGELGAEFGARDVDLSSLEDFDALVLFERGQSGRASRAATAVPSGLLIKERLESAMKELGLGVKYKQDTPNSRVVEWLEKGFNHSVQFICAYLFLCCIVLELSTRFLPPCTGFERCLF